MLPIDAHQHFWKTSRDDYGWLTPALGPIYRDFMPPDLQPLLAAADIDRTVLVQAAASEAETFFLLDVAAQTDFVAGVVGWVDLEASNAPDRVVAMAERGVLGLRPMVQDIADTEWLLRPALHPALKAMIAADLRFDALIQPRHLLVLDRFVQLYPGLKIVIDHGAKPDIANGMIDDWAAGMHRLAAGSDIYCKLSGLVTEAGELWDDKDIIPYAQVLIDAFGPERLMWGSDWPVLNMASDYAGWNSLSEALLGRLSPEQISQIRGGNAARFYGIEE
jgi:L-fuconolactonase